MPSPDAAGAEVADGFRAEVVMSGLTYPTSVELDDAGTLYVAEAGYSYGDASAKPRILRVSADGTAKVIAQGPPLNGPINDLLWHQGRMYVSHRGKISALGPDGQLRDLVPDLPSDGDHHNNQLTVGPDGKLYFGQGTATNSGVVGPDNYAMGWLKGGLRNPYGLMWSADGTLYATENGFDVRGSRPIANDPEDGSTRESARSQAAS